jgi:hypothetical protein
MTARVEVTDGLSAEVEHGGRQHHRKQAVKGQMGKPVRNTVKPGLRPIVGPQ